jgi:hypothetical protein
LRIFGNCDSKASAHEPTLQFIKLLAGHILDGALVYDNSQLKGNEESKDP